MKNIYNYTTNKEYVDEFGRVSGIFVVDKLVNLTSHDIVYQYRKKFNTKKVGHAGALDPFATGLLIILVGKALKLSESFLNLDKEYIADVLIGVTTDSFDVEGKVIDVLNKDIELSDNKINKVLNSFIGEYNQYVPVFSSVKVNGNKLRELARSSDKFEIEKFEDRRVVKFFKGERVKEVNLPIKKVNIYSIDNLGVSKLNINDLENINSNFYAKLENINKDINYYLLKIKVSVSKGTYIRQLAFDIGEELGVPAMLLNLRRTRVGEYSI